MTMKPIGANVMGRDDDDDDGSGYEIDTRVFE